MDHEAYLTTVTTTIQALLGNGVHAIWLSGSVGFEDVQVSSDLDLIVVSRDRIGRDKKGEIVARLTHSELPCPALGLDLAIYRLEQLTCIKREPEFELGFTTGREWADESEFGGLYPGALIDLDICRELGRSLHGPSPRDVIGAIPREWLIEEVFKTFDWHRRHVLDPFHDPLGVNAVLNACRAWHFLVVGRWCSKSFGAEWAAGLCGYGELIEAAAKLRKGGEGGGLELATIQTFLDEVQARLPAS